MFTHLRWHRLPALLGELLLLLGIDSQAGAGNGELNKEQHEQNDHVLHRDRGQRVKCNQYKMKSKYVINAKETNSLSGNIHKNIATWPPDNTLPPNDAIAATVRKSFASSFGPSHSFTASIASLVFHLKA